jgi:hypothetical protein
MSKKAQPRSGGRIQPTAQAVGAKVVSEEGPKGRKNGYDTTLRTYSKERPASVALPNV